MTEPTIWHVPGTQRWWMDHINQQVAVEDLQREPAAVAITNAQDVLDVDFLEKLTREAGRWPERADG